MLHGEPVPLVFTVTNAGPETRTVPLLGRDPTADFRVFDRSGAEIWSHLQGAVMPGPLRLHPLAGGARLTFRQEWRQRDNHGHPVSPGEYGVAALLLTDQPHGLASDRVMVQVLPRPAGGH